MLSLLNDTRKWGSVPLKNRSGLGPGHVGQADFAQQDVEGAVGGLYTTLGGGVIGPVGGIAISIDDGKLEVPGTDVG